ncbi:MAG: radical SAM protein [Candidatus Omnitrophica bacterium]|nr:radical SAM protein [Candidatus Omnitrophota bacterium]MDD5238193.1 radical SAM protein [Candidatus Omnitrophota bacterium]
MFSINEQLNRIKEFRLRLNNQPEENLPLPVKRIAQSIKNIDKTKNRLQKNTFKKNKEVSINSIIIKPVGIRCNLGCTYCSAETTRKRKGCPEGKMSLRLIERLILQIDKYLQGHILLYWQGGEPLLAGVDFYKQVVEMQKDILRNNKNVMVVNLIQTNATLLNEDWINFFKKSYFGVTISLDGSELDHNLSRKYIDSRGSYNDVIHSVQLLRRSGIKVGATATISPLHSRNPKEFIESFIKAGISSVHIRHCYDKDLLLTPLQYADFIIELFDAWLNTDCEIEFSIFKDIFLRLLNRKSAFCYNNGVCGSYPAVEVNGDVWLCDESFTNKNYLWGNINKTNFIDMMKSKKYKDFCRIKQRVYKKCFLNCEWFIFCFGDCLYHYTIGTKKELIGDKNYYCEGLRKIYEYIVYKINRIMEGKL